MTDEEKAVSEEEGKTYISGDVTFIKDDPGRQEIGSFNPITETDWTGKCHFKKVPFGALIVCRNGIRREY